MKRVVSLFVIFIFLSAVVSAVELPNPAAVKCKEDGYKLESRTLDDGSAYGICIFEDSECGQWDYFKGECKQKQCSKVEGYFECEEGCKPPQECCSFELKCTPYEEKGFRALFKKYFYLIFAWLWIEAEEDSFEEDLEEPKYFEGEEPLEF